MKKYLLNIAIGFDQFINTIIGGDPDETISGRLGRIKRANGGVIFWTRPLARIIDAGLESIDPGHSIKSIEEDEGLDAVCDTQYKKEGLS